MKALNCRYLVMFLGAAFVLLAVVAGYSTPTPPKRDSTVVITIAAAADPAPEEGLRLFLSSSGSLRDLDGEERACGGGGGRRAHRCQRTSTTGH